MMRALKELAAQPGWWRDVLQDEKLIIGVRENYLNVYWRGQSIFRVDMTHERIVASTHPKYLLDPALKGQVKLHPETGVFALDSLELLTRAYVPGETLAKLKKMAERFPDEEKEGVQAIVNANPNVVDLEITFPADPGYPGLPRIDIATFKEVPGGVRLVFWEAKRYQNKELRGSGENDVVKQIATYRTCLARYPDAVIKAYRAVAHDLVAIADMSNRARSISSIIRDVAEGAPLFLSSPPDVGLLIFDFDEDQREGGLKKLRAARAEHFKGIDIKAVGAPGQIKL